MSDQKLDLDKKIILPIVLLFIAVTLQDILYFVPGFFKESVDFELVRIVLTGGFVLFSTVLIVAASMKKRKLFYWITLAACIALTFYAVFYHFFINMDAEVNLILQVSDIISSLFFLLLLFMIFAYREPLLNNNDTSNSFLTFLGVYYLVRGLALGLQFFIQTQSLHLSLYISAAIYCVVGLGLIAKNRFWGFFGTLVLVAISAFRAFSFFKYHDIAMIFIGINNMLLPLFVFIISIILFSDFKKMASSSPSYSGGYSGGYTTYSTSKTCGRCGKPVSSSASAGQSCPHCGAYWGSERTTTRHY